MITIVSIEVEHVEVSITKRSCSEALTLVVIAYIIDDSSQVSSIDEFTCRRGRFDTSIKGNNQKSECSSELVSDLCDWCDSAQGYDDGAIKPFQLLWRLRWLSVSICDERIRPQI